MKTNIQEDEMTSVNAKQEALLDELLKDYTDPRDILGEHGLLKHLTKRVAACSHLSGQDSNRAKCEVAIRFNRFQRPAL